jgi:elongation factor Ts
MHIAAAEPRFVRREEVTADVLEREKAIYREQTIAAGKPEKMIDKIVEGKIEKFYSEAVLLEQAYVKNPDQTVGQLVIEKIAKIGENIQIRRFSRFRLGEGIEKRKEDFAAEVAAVVGTK